MCEKVPSFTDDEQNFVIRFLAFGMRPVDVPDVFMEQHPEFAKDIDEDERRKAIFNRARGYACDKRRPSYAKIQEIRKTCDPEFGDIPLTNAWVRLNAYQLAYDLMPKKIVETTVEVIETDPGGTVTKTKTVEKSNIQPVLAILNGLGRELKQIDLLPAPTWNPGAKQSSQPEQTGPQFDSLEEDKLEDEKKGGPIVV